MRLSTRLTLAMVALVLLTATAVGLLTYRNVIALALPRALERIDSHTKLLAIGLEASVRGVRGDVNTQGRAVDGLVSANLAGGAHPLDGTSEAVWRERLASRFVAELTAKPDYAVFRLIGIADGGREIVRVDRLGPGGAIRVAPGSDLQRVGDREYFKAATRLSVGEVYVSPVDLKRRDGVIQTPPVPVVRVAAPVLSPAGAPFGLLAIDFDLQSAFAPIRAAIGARSQIYLVNEKGDYLIHPDRGREFGFLLGSQHRLQDDFPEFTEALKEVDTAPRVASNRGGERFGVGWEKLQLAGGPVVAMIEAVPYSQVTAAATAIFDSSLSGGLLAVLAALALAVILARSLTRPLVQMTRAVEGFARDEPMTMATDGKGEIGVLAGAFSRMAAESREKTDALKREIEERRLIFDTSLDLLLVTDKRGRFVRVSPSVFDILGYKPEELVGHSAVDFIYPEDLEPTRNEMRLARRGQVVRNFESRYHHKDGRTVLLGWSGVWSEDAQRYFFIGRDFTERKRAEDELRKTREFLNTILENVPNSISVKNAHDLRYVSVNRAGEEFFGFSREQMIGKSASELFSKQIGDDIDTRDRQTLDCGGQLVFENTPVFVNGQPRLINSTKVVIRGADGEPQYLLGVVEDVTERKRAETALKQFAEREQQFIAAVESTDDAIINTTLDGIITSWNPAAERIFGYTAEEAIGQNVQITIPENLRSRIPQVLEGLRVGRKWVNQDTVRVTKDGRLLNVSSSITPVRSASGMIVGATGIARDITEEKRTQEAILEGDRMARGIVDTALDAFVQMDDAGSIIDWNAQAEAVFGWSREEAIGKTLSALIIPPRHRDRHDAGLARFLRTGESAILGRRFEIEAVRRDGKELAVDLAVTSLRRRSGFVFNAFIRDLTEKKAAEERHQQALKMEAVGQLTGGIAHDFNNMLTVITGTIEILAEGVADKPELAAIAKLIGEAADRGAELTGHLLAFARKQPLQPRAIDINTLVANAQKLLRSLLGENIELRSNLAPTAWPVLADPSQLSTALVNLAINARDAMPGGGKLVLETQNVVLDEGYAKLNGDVQPGNYVMVAVSDSGGGIPAAIRDKVFEPFFTTKDVGKGTGLGLSMVYGFVKQSGGHIKLYSEEGHGTTFKIYLPQAGAASQEMDGAPESAPVEGGSETILIVEDDAMVRTYVETQIQGLGYKTLLAANAAEALAVADQGATFDLLFTDVIMPGPMNGRQLADEMAKRRSPLRVLFTSGYTEDAIIHHGRLEPGVLLLAKPYRRSDLARMLRAALDGDDNLQGPVEMRRQVAT